MSRVKRFTAAVAALAAAGLVGCSDSMVQPTVSQRSPSGSPGRVITPVLSDVIVTTTGGSFANPIVPTEAGRGAGAFWDNISSDDHDPPVVKCNIGYFAIGTISPLCNFTAPGSTPGGYANYFGNGAGNTGSPDFMFNGKYSYDVKIVGAYSFGTSTVGYFTKSGGTYTLTSVATWTAKSIGAAVSFTTPGNVDWGFFATNDNFTGQRTCGAGTLNTTCSDATGGFLVPPLQQHALFINAAGDQFLVGLEDNLLGLWNGDCPSALHPGCSPPNPTNQDSDYQDYIFNIVPHIIPSGGCTFTKGWYRNHGSNTVIAVDGRTKAQAQAIFAATPGKPGGVTWQGGNDLLNLYQQLLAAILNGGTGGPANVQAAIAAAQAGTGGTGLNITTTLTQSQISTLMNTLDDFNSGKDAGFPHCGDTA
jgi:hypothetical protein